MTEGAPVCRSRIAMAVAEADIPVLGANGAAVLSQSGGIPSVADRSRPATRTGEGATP